MTLNNILLACVTYLYGRNKPNETTGVAN